MISGNHCDRNTKAYTVCIGSVVLTFSYNTLVGFSAPEEQGRCENVWGPTTGKHMDEMGCGNYPVVGNVEDSAYAAIQREALRNIQSRFDRRAA